MAQDRAAGELQEEGEVSQEQVKHGARGRIIPIRATVGSGSAELPQQDPRCPGGL